MPLRSPRRISKRFARKAGSDAWRVTRRTYGAPERRRRRRHERSARTARRMGQMVRSLMVEGRTWVIVIALLASLSIFGFLLVSPYASVREIRIRRQDGRIDPKEVQSVLSPLFSKKLLLVTAADVRTRLQNVFPDIASTSISKDYPSTLIVTIESAPVIALLSIGSASDIEAGSGSTLFDETERHLYVIEDGHVVGSPIAIDREPLPHLTVLDWSIRPQERSLLIDGKKLKQVLLTRDMLRRDFGLETRDILLFLRSQEFHIVTPTVTLWFDLRTDITVQFERLRGFLQTLSLDKVAEYIDLRIAEKVVYR